MTTGSFDSSVGGTPAVSAKGTNGAPGVVASSDTGKGIVGSSDTSSGVSGHGGKDSAGVHGEGSVGVYGYTWYGVGIGVRGESDAQTGIGVEGRGTSNGVKGISQTNLGVRGDGGIMGVYGEGGSIGVRGHTVTGIGVSGQSVAQTGIGVKGEGSQYGVEGVSSSGFGIHGSGSKGAGFFEGNVTVTGDVILTGADCAEEFDVAATVEVEPGTVVVLDQEGVLQPSQQAYDKRVAGVVSGAGNYKPGIVLDKQESSENRMPVALVGKVYCKVDAQYAAIEVGDLLTTSSTPGHAMKADDPFKAFGSVIGKALRSLEAGQGMIPILIALQ